MKRVCLITALTVAFIPVANAVEFNTGALRSMQQEGLKIVGEAQGRTYKTSSGLCLDIAEVGLVVKLCDANSKSQIWKIDGQSRLVADDGRCVAGAQLQVCGPGNAQKWKVDDKKRLSNAEMQCLQAEGNPPKAGAKVSATACSAAPNQIWQ